MRTPRGFTLLEVLAWIGITVVFAAVVAGLALRWQRGGERARAIDYQGREFSALADAVRQYTEQNAGLFSTTAATPVTVNTLIGAGLLPTDFAKRNGSAGRTPWWQSYTAAGRMGDDGRVQAILYETGAPDAERLRQTGTSADAAAVLALKTHIATRLASAQHLAAAWLEPGQTQAQGAYGAFTKDMVDYLPAAPSVASAAVLIGFADLDGTDPNAGPPGGGLGLDLTGCKLVQPTMTRGAPVCPADAPREVARWPFCAAWNNAFPKYVAYPSQAGTITVGIERRYTSAEKVLCTHDGFFPPPNCVRERDEERAGLAFIHGGRFEDLRCEATIYGLVDIYNLRGGSLECLAAPEGGPLFPESAVDDYYGRVCTIETTRPELTLGTDAYNILCCAHR